MAVLGLVMVVVQPTSRKRASDELFSMIDKKSQVKYPEVCTHLEGRKYSTFNYRMAQSCFFRIRRNATHKSTVDYSGELLYQMHKYLGDQSTLEEHLCI